MEESGQSGKQLLVLDFDWTYRKALPAVAHAGRKASSMAYKAFWDQTDQIVRLLISRLRHAHRPPGYMGEPWPTGETALWAAVILGLTLILASL